MRDDDLDSILDEPQAALAASTVALAREVAMEAIQTSGERRSRRRFIRLRILVPAGVGLVALTGAGTYSAYQLSVPPFVETGPGVQRVEKPVPVDFVTDSGLRVECGWWAEFSNATPLQRDQLEAMSTDHDWKGYGQQMYDRLPSPDRTSRDWPGERFSALVGADLSARALAAAPGLTRETVSTSPQDAVLAGWTFRCGYPNGRS